MGRVTEQSRSGIELPSTREIRDFAADAWDSFLDSPAVPWNRGPDKPPTITPTGPSQSWSDDDPRLTRATVKGDIRPTPSGIVRDDGKFQFGLQEQMAAEKDKASGYARAIRDYQQQINELNQSALAAVKAGANEVASKYDEQIAEVEKQMAEARLQLKRSMAAYEHYASQVAPAYQAAVDAAVAGEQAQKDALSGRAEAAVGQIQSNREASVEDVEEVADLIGTGGMVSDGNIDEALGEFSQMFKEAARSNIDEIDRISAAGAKFATALADAEMKKGLFSNEVEKAGLEAQIKGQLDDLAEQAAELEKDKQRAVAEAMAMYDPIGGFEDPDALFEFVFDSIALNGGWDLDEINAVKAMFGEAQADGVRTRADALEWIDERISITAASRLNEYLVGHGIDPEDMPAGRQAILVDIVTGTTAQQQAAVQLLQQIYRLDDLDQGFIDGLFMDRTDFDHLLDTFDAYETHVKEWDKNKYVPANKGSQAPNNYANRNAPQYVARRTIGVPTFAKMFNAQFGYSGRENIGGVSGGSLIGLLRDPSRGATNSDHQSGGALDLYPESEAEFDEIERWARSQPGVSLVIGRGRSDHDTGVYGPPGTPGRSHVHVSLQLGYWG